MAENEDRNRPPPKLADWERKLADIISYKFERVELEELKAELYKTIVELKLRPLSHVKNWERYLAKALLNRADNWTRRRRDTVKRESTLAEHETQKLSLPKEDDLDDQLTIAQFRRALGTQLRKTLAVLEKHNFNQVKAADELGIHRNTLGSRFRKIKQIARRFPPDARSEERTVIKERVPSRFVVLSSRFLQRVARIRLSGTAGRVLLWIVRELSWRKQATVPLRWRRIMTELALDPGSVTRATQSLVNSGLVFIQHDRIGLRRRIGVAESKRSRHASRRLSTKIDVKKQRF